MTTSTVDVQRPGLLHALFHAILYLSRCSFLASCAAVFVIGPLYTYCVRPLVAGLSDEVAFTVVLALLGHFLPFLVYNSVFLYIDYTVHHREGDGWVKRRFAPYALPRKPAQVPSKAQVMSTLRSALVQQLVLAPLGVYMLLRYLQPDLPPRSRYISGFEGGVEAALPLGAAISGGEAAAVKQLQHTLWVVMIRVFPHFFFANLCNEVFFFLVHAAMHRSSVLYRWIHKKHHEYKGTLSLAVDHAHPIEDIFANIIPTVMYFFVMFVGFSNRNGSAYVRSARVWPLFLTWLWARLWETYESHSGFCFADSWLGRLGLLHGKRTRFHDFHHTHNVGNYGSCVIMDALFHTMDPYLRHRARSRKEKAV